MWNQLLNTKEKVRHILQMYPALRDSDNKLIATFWSMEAADISTYKAGQMSAKELLNMLYKNLLTSPESIRRCRQKLQEESEELRGTVYYQKQNEGKTITKNINKEWK